MRLEHLALYTRELDRLRDFYVRWFGAVSNERYHSKSGMQSYFLQFDGGARLELMWLPTLADPPAEPPRVGLTHLAFHCGGEERVRALTEALRTAGYAILSEPRTTGDGYFESCIADPDGNRIELVG